MRHRAEPFKFTGGAHMNRFAIPVLALAEMLGQLDNHALHSKN